MIVKRVYMTLMEMVFVMFVDLARTHLKIHQQTAPAIAIRVV